MSVEPKRNGALRLRCDSADCERKFVPLRPLTEPAQLRKRAALYGWTSSFGQDHCPEHEPRTPNLGGIK